MASAHLSGKETLESKADPIRWQVEQNDQTPTYAFFVKLPKPRVDIRNLKILKISNLAHLDSLTYVENDSKVVSKSNYAS